MSRSIVGKVVPADRRPKHMWGVQWDPWTMESASYLVVVVERYHPEISDNDGDDAPMDRYIVADSRGHSSQRHDRRKDLESD